MVSDDTVNFRLPTALYERGQAFIDSGGAESQSELVINALINQITEDLRAVQKKEPLTIRSTKTSYTTGKNADNRMVSVRISPAILKNIDQLCELGVAENRTAYVRRAYANEIARENTVTLEKLFKSPEKLAKDPFFREALRIYLGEYYQAAANNIR